MKINYTKYQFASINAHGPVVVSAGPGAGKTRVMIARVLRMMKQGVLPEDIFATTFTKKATGEFAARIKSANPNGSSVNVSTIHALALRILRDMNKNVKIAQQFDLLNWARRINRDEPEDVLNRVSRVRCANMGDDKDKEIAKKYTKFLKEKNVTDMDGIVLMATPLVAMWAKTHTVKAFIVDEFQDTDPSQWHFIRKIVQSTGADFCGVGDPDQSIYGFRGSLPQIFRFAMDDLQAKHIFLTDCFRCRPHIINDAVSVLNMEKNKAKRVIISHKAESEKHIQLVSTNNAVEQGTSIAKIVKQQLSEGIPTNEIAILGRTRDSLAVTTMILQAAGIPINAESWQNPFNTKTRRIVLGVIRFMAGSVSIDVFINQAASLGFTIAEHQLKTLYAMIDSPFESFEKQALKLFTGWQRQSALHSLEIAREAFTGDWKELETRCLTMRKQISCVKDGVTIATAHASKGREWQSVFVAGCDNNNFPHPQAHHVNEERRILFVAMTRAKEKLCLITPSTIYSEFLNPIILEMTMEQQDIETVQKHSKNKGLLHSLFSMVGLG